MHDDPGEQNNILLHDPQQKDQDVRDKMFNELVAYEKHWGLEGMVEWNDMHVLKAYDLPTGTDARHWARSPWYVNMNDSQRAALGSEWDEVIEAVAKEDSVKLHDLDLEGWKRKCAVPDKIIQRIRKEKL
ncbi:MAG: hypothetical protein HRU15_08650 [Planctomycetes bacterium]|nr:hypothetical protein [Planctomycetota bacterium]